MPKFISPLVKQLREAFINSYDFKEDHHIMYGDKVLCHIETNAYIKCDNFFQLRIKQTKDGEEYSPFINETRPVPINFVERIYLWGAVRDKVAEISSLSDHNRLRSW